MVMRYHHNPLRSIEGRYQYSNNYCMLIRWEPEGRYRCIKSMAIAPFWFSTKHRWIVITPFCIASTLRDIVFISKCVLKDRCKIRPSHFTWAQLKHWILKTLVYVTYFRLNLQACGWNDAAFDLKSPPVNGNSYLLWSLLSLLNFYESLMRFFFLALPAITIQAILLLQNKTLRY